MRLLFGDVCNILSLTVILKLIQIKITTILMYVRFCYGHPKVINKGLGNHAIIIHRLRISKLTW